MSGTYVREYRGLTCGVVEMLHMADSEGIMKYSYRGGISFEILHGNRF
jgi:hypothetical protein